MDYSLSAFRGWYFGRDRCSFTFRIKEKDMPDMRDIRQPQDHVLAPGEYLYALDNTKAIVGTFVGPHTMPASGNLTPVLWNNGRFVRKERYDDVTQQFVSISEGYYLELANPSRNVEHPHPMEGPNTTGMTDLDFGRRIVIPGPAYFALWPRQTHKVLEGHQMRTNQYLLVRVYNDKDAIENWANAVIKKAADTPEAEQAVAKPEKLTTGQLLVIKGTEVSFFIPPTGIEVVPDPKGGSYVRDAVTLEQMELCILKEERGKKRYVHGPDVVFPSPTETFVEVGGTVKFKPVELNANSGLYIKVIAAYEEDGVQYKEGDELFITGDKQAIYYPRPEHNVIQYEGQPPIHFAVAVTPGEARYVLNRDSGNVDMRTGPTMLLPDPRKEVIVRRVLDKSQVELWYPGNSRAIEVNDELRARLRASGDPALASETMVRGLLGATERSSMETFAGEAIRRKSTFTPPRTVTLDAKYDGVPGVNVWPGYAVLVTDKSGKREVVEGPAPRLLAYDEVLMPMELSTGTPKSDKTTLKTVYLQVHNNRVSDKIENAETKDLVRVDLAIAYRVNFEGEDRLKWFNVDNYVRFLTEHLRSLLRNAVKQHGIEEFYKDPITIIRDAVLGKSVEGKRAGRRFEENGMRIYEVDVLDVSIKDAAIAKLLEGAQSDALRTVLEVAAKSRQLTKTQQVEEIERKIADEEAKTREAKLNHAIADVKKQLEKLLADVDVRSQQEMAGLRSQEAQQETLDTISAAKLAREKADKEQELALAAKEAEQELARIAQESKAFVERMGAVDEKLVVALQAFSDRDLMAKAAASVGQIAVLRNIGIADLLDTLFKGFGSEKSLTLPPQRS
jgi:major vault protein